MAPPHTEPCTTAVELKGEVNQNKKDIGVIMKTLFDRDNGIVYQVAQLKNNRLFWLQYLTMILGLATLFFAVLKN